MENGGWPPNGRRTAELSEGKKWRDCWNRYLSTTFMVHRPLAKWRESLPTYHIYYIQQNRYLAKQIATYGRFVSFFVGPFGTQKNSRNATYLLYHIRDRRQNWYIQNDLLYTPDTFGRQLIIIYIYDPLYLRTKETYGGREHSTEKCFLLWTNKTV
jgi:hypothetical protein